MKALKQKLCYELRNHSTATKIMEDLKRMPPDESHNLSSVKLFAWKKRLKASFSETAS